MVRMRLLPIVLVALMVAPGAAAFVEVPSHEPVLTAPGPVAARAAEPTEGSGHGLVTACIGFLDFVEVCWTEAGSASFRIDQFGTHGSVSGITDSASCTQRVDGTYEGEVGSYPFGGPCDGLAVDAAWVVEEAGLCSIYVAMSGTDGIRRASRSGDVIGTCT